MKKYILLTLLSFIPLLGFSADFTIDETKSDIYFANGVLTTEKNADKNLDLIRETVRLDQYGGSYTKLEKDLSFKKAYNQTFGFAGDFYEALMQKADESFGWEALYNTTKLALALAKDQEIEVTLSNGEVINIPAPLFDQFVQITHEADLTKQVTSYRESIRQGHSVVVLAHSQGNLFTNEAYQKIISSDDGRENNWLKEYFTRVSIATPANVKFGGDIVVSFHNDPVPDMGTLPTIGNPNKAYLKNALGDIIDEDALSADFHAFTYYMGEKSAQGTGQVGSGYHGKVSTDIAKNIIMNFIKDAINKHKTAQSQWAVDEEFEEGTKEYRVTLKHFYGDLPLSNMMKDKKVFPFNPKNKLYQVPDTDGTLHYVKASFGGERILDAELDSAIWEAKDNEFYKLEGTGEIIGKENIISSYFDKDDEGWKIVGDAQLGSHKPNYMDGYIQAIDDGRGDFWYFQAPKKFSGNLIIYYGGIFSYDLKQDSAEYPARDKAMDIIIKASTKTIGYYFTYSPNNSWTKFSIVLTEQGWKDINNNDVTKDEFRDILKNVQTIQIRGEYSNTIDIGSLDNVILSK